LETALKPSLRLVGAEEATTCNKRKKKEDQAKKKKGGPRADQLLTQKAKTRGIALREGNTLILSQLTEKLQKGLWGKIAQYKESKKNAT